ncbi:transposase [Thiocapsa sp.]|uniref:transposase n=1 Tax=Thiocapsa sp. TaxID=2024551 RepID=UPI002629E2A2|nr:transposase [Thiocapsa sp.]
MWRDLRRLEEQRGEVAVATYKHPALGLQTSRLLTPESSLDSGFDGGKLVKGRKRHIVVDTMGCLLIVYVHAANIFDGKAARKVLADVFVLVRNVKIIWANCGYSGRELLIGYYRSSTVGSKS